MQTLNLIQGSPEWLAARAQYFTASEAPAMLGVSKYQTRSALLKQKATGLIEEVDPATQRLFDAGHASEALARPIVEGILGEELYPVTGTREVDGLPLLASFDGLTMMETIAWENKLFNAGLAEAVLSGELEPHYWAQLEQQLLVSCAQRVYFTTSDGTPERTLGVWYESIPARRAQLISGWKQFAEDLANYQHHEEKAIPNGRAPDALPALHIEVTGAVTASNLAAFKSHALAVFDGIKTELATDADFADAEKTVKWCGEVEERLEAAKRHALSQTASIDELFRTIDAIKAEARAKRLELDKLVKTRKETIRVEIQQRGKDALAAHITALNTRLGQPYMPTIAADFAGVMKGKKTVASLNDAVDTELARAKIEASAIADRISINLSAIHSDHAHLFPDLAQIVLKAHDDLVALIKVRIAEEATRIEVVRQDAAKVAEPVIVEPIVQPVAKAPIVKTPLIPTTTDAVLRQFVEAYERNDQDALRCAYHGAVELLKGDQA